MSSQKFVYLDQIHTKMTPIKKEEIKSLFVELYQSTACNVSACCRKVGISRNTFYEWKKYDKEFADKIKDEEESMIDFAETMLYKAIKEGKTAELIFYLKTKGKDRGYVEKQEYEVSTQKEPDLSELSTDEILTIINAEESSEGEA